MKLNEIGEFGLIERFAPHFATQLPANTLGIGDDCAVFPSGDELMLVTTDLLVENIHFLKNGISAHDLGYKSLAVNLSDIAAMGGQPIMSFLSLALPKDIDVEWTDDFFAGYRKLSQKSNTLLMGGDTTRSTDAIIINVAVIGKANPDQVKYRSGAKPGDLICTTGLTGESGAGLQAILNDWPDGDLTNYMKHKHNHPEPHIEEGLLLAKFPGVHAMMDVSDGIDSDLRHILKRSDVSAKIDLDKIPLSRELQSAASQNGLNPVTLALTAGEDYCLLLTVDAQLFNTINEQFKEKFNRPLNAIGEIISGNQGLQYYHHGEAVALDGKGFDHFK